MNRKWVPFLACLAFVGSVIFFADTGSARWLFAWIEEHPGSDKVGHFVLVGALAFTLNLALGGRKIAGLLLGGLIVAFVFAMEEGSQAWLPQRNFDLGDLLANLAGCAIADPLARLCLARRGRPATTARDEN